MSDTYFAVIKEVEDKLLSNGKEVRFCGQGIHIFNPILKDTLIIEDQLNSGNNELNSWTVTFFKDSTFSQTLKLEIKSNQLFKSINEAKVKDEDVISKVALFINSENLSEENVSLRCTNASWFIRGSETFTKDCLQVFSNQKRFIDGRGLVLFSDKADIKEPKRRVLLLMLVLAYQLAFQQINEELADALDRFDFNGKDDSKIKKLDDLYAEASLFNARNYFFNPIQLSKYPTYKCWEDFREAFQLPMKYRETNEQISQVHSILNHQRQKLEDADRQKEIVEYRKEQQKVEEERQKLDEARLEQQKSTDKLNSRIGMFGLFLSLIGIIEVFDVLKGWVN